jgi:alkylhydroperoxidase family enzyme
MGAETGRRTVMTDKPRISYVSLDDMTPEMRAEMERCAREGTPRPESSAVRAHVPTAFWAFANSWRDLFRDGVLDHDIKELCRVYVSRSVKCEYCGNQRSEKGRSMGLTEGKYDDLLNFESSEEYDDRQKAALAYAEAITWHLDTDDSFWERLHQHFDEAELVELGCFVGLTMGQQSWLRLLDIDHHQVMPGTTAAMAPGFESAGDLARSKASEGYWAKV